MTKKTSFASLLPVIILVALALGAGFFLIKDEIKLPKFFSKEPQTRRIADFPGSINTDRQIEKQRAVITNEQELLTFLKTIDPTGNTSFPEKIDFNKEYLLAASTDTLHDAYSTLKIKKVFIDSKTNQLVVSIWQNKPVDACNAPKQERIAYDIVAISKPTVSISFELVKHNEENCDVFTSQSNSTTGK